jgi:hypothetical protein
MFVQQCRHSAASFEDSARGGCDVCIRYFDHAELIQHELQCWPAGSVSLFQNTSANCNAVLMQVVARLKITACRTESMSCPHGQGKQLSAIYALPEQRRSSAHASFHHCSEELFLQCSCIWHVQNSDEEVKLHNQRELAVLPSIIIFKALIHSTTLQVGTALPPQCCVASHCPPHSENF